MPTVAIMEYTDSQPTNPQTVGTMVIIPSDIMRAANARSAGLLGIRRRAEIHQEDWASAKTVTACKISHSMSIQPPGITMAEVDSMFVQLACGG